MNAKTILLAVAALSAAMAASAYEVTPNTKIVIPDIDKTGVGAALKAAAAELQLDVEEATGWKLAVVEGSRAGDTAGAILIGERFAAEAGLVPDGLRNFDNVIAERGGRLYLFGHDRACRKSSRALPWYQCILASVKAVTDFEYAFMGVKRLQPGRTGTEVPKRDRISVPDGFRRVNRPAMENGMGRQYGMMYSIANNIFGNGTYSTYGGHIYHEIFGGKNFREDHPEYYATIGGKMTKKARKFPSLCISNPDVRNLIIQFIIDDFDRGADVVELGQQDSDEYCECERCRAYGGPEAKTAGEKYWIFHRSIAEELHRKRPGKTVMITSYWVTDCRPTTFREFPPNVMIELMTFSEEVFAAWRDYVVPRGFSLYTYMWGGYQPPGLTCKASTHVFARLARRFARHNVHSIYRCGYGELFGTEGPATYVFNQMLADPDLDENALFEEYVTGSYGPAAAHMRKFHRALDERVAAWAMCYNDERKWPWPRERTGNNTINAIYTPATIELCAASLAAAEKTQGLSEKAKRRLALVRREWDYTRLTAEGCMLYDAYRIAPNAALFEDIASRVERRRALVKATFDGNGRARPIAGWPEYVPFGQATTLECMMKNGRLHAVLQAPFNWDIDSVRKTFASPGALKKTARVSRSAAGGPWSELGGMTLGPCDRKTRFRCRYDDTNFYLEVDAELEDALTFTPAGHDGKCDRQECLELFIDPLYQKSRSFHFMWNPVANSFYDEAYGLSSDPLDPEADKFQVSWDGKWDYTVERGNGRWRSVVSVPFATLGVAKPLPGAKWYLNVGRESYRDGQQQLHLWSPSMGGRGMGDLESMGTVEFE